MKYSLEYYQRAMGDLFKIIYCQDITLDINHINQFIQNVYNQDLKSMRPSELIKWLKNYLEQIATSFKQSTTFDIEVLIALNSDIHTALNPPLIVEEKKYYSRKYDEQDIRYYQEKDFIPYLNNPYINYGHSNSEALNQTAGLRIVTNAAMSIVAFIYKKKLFGDYSEALGWLVASIPLIKHDINIPILTPNYTEDRLEQYYQIHELTHEQINKYNDWLKGLAKAYFENKNRIRNPIVTKLQISHNQLINDKFIKEALLNYAEETLNTDKLYSELLADNIFIEDYYQYCREIEWLDHSKEFFNIWQEIYPPATIYKHFYNIIVSNKSHLQPYVYNYYGDNPTKSSSLFRIAVLSQITRQDPIQFINFNLSRIKTHQLIIHLVTQYSLQHPQYLGREDEYLDLLVMALLKPILETHREKIISDQELIHINDSINASILSVINESVHKAASNSELERMGLSFISIAKDGHCLYGSAGLYLGETPDFLRRRVAARLEHNLEEFAPFITLASGQRLEDYLNAVREGNEWASHTEIEVLMRVLDRPILVIGPDNRLVNPADRQRFAGEPIFVYYNGHNHYDGLVLQEGRDAQFVLSQLDNAAAVIQQPLTQINEHSLINGHLPSDNQAHKEKEYIDKIKEYTDIFLSAEKQREYETYFKQAVEFGSMSIEINAKNFLRQAAYDYAYGHLFQERLETLIAPRIEQMLQQLAGTTIEYKEHHLTLIPLKLQDHQNRQAILMAGGAAAGKTSLQNTTEFKNNLSQDGYAVFNTDLYKKVLLFSTGYTVNNKDYSDFVQQECSLITGKIIKNLKSMAQFPQFIFDSIRTNENNLSIIKLAGQSKVYVATCELATAVERAYHRAKKEGRYIKTSAVLNGHIEQSQLMPWALNNYRNISFYIYNTELGANRIAYKERVTDILVVEDMKAFLRFALNQLANTNAAPPGEIYPQFTNRASLLAYLLVPYLNKSLKIQYQHTEITLQQLDVTVYQQLIQLLPEDTVLQSNQDVADYQSYLIIWAKKYDDSNFSSLSKGKYLVDLINSKNINELTDNLNQILIKNKKNYLPGLFNSKLPSSIPNVETKQVDNTYSLKP